MAATATEKAIAKRIAIWAPEYRDAVWWGSGASDPAADIEPGGRVLAFIQAAIQAHTAASFLAVYNDAMACWALHWLTLAERAEASAFGSSVSGPVTSIRTGDESIGFQQTSMSAGAPGDLHFMETTWGKRYISYRDSRPDAHMFIV